MEVLVGWAVAGSLPGWGSHVGGPWPVLWAWGAASTLCASVTSGRGDTCDGLILGAGIRLMSLRLPLRLGRDVGGTSKTCLRVSFCF